MTKTIQRRLRALEAALQRKEPGPYVFESMDAARAAGADGGVLIIGPVMTYSDWGSIAPKQQADLILEENHALH